ncbi:hypothetical protein C0J52_27052 [Blattella germanica]|nr:hypothetical protein C0J52_27052 [Blattella germanica]
MARRPTGSIQLVKQHSTRPKNTEPGVYFARPPHFPAITSCDFYIWGFIKDHVYVPPLSVGLK